MADDDVVVSDDAAEALWRRAAQLQAEYLQRADTSPTDASLTPPAAAADDLAEPGRRLSHVRQAAIEAGIAGRFVDLALAELPRDDAGAPMPAAVVSSAQPMRGASVLLGTREWNIAVTRVVHGTPAQVLHALGAVWRAAPWSLRVRPPVGGHPLQGGVLVFDLPDSTTEWVYLRQGLYAKQLQVTLRAAPGAPDDTELTVFADTRSGVKANLIASSALSGTFGGLFSFGAAAIAMKQAALVGALVVGAPVVAGVAVVGACALGYRAIYRYCVRTARQELERAIDALEVNIDPERIFGSQSS